MVGETKVRILISIMYQKRKKEYELPVWKLPAICRAERMQRIRAASYMQKMPPSSSQVANEVTIQIPLKIYN